VRKKNILGTMMQSFAMMAVTILWPWWLLAGLRHGNWFIGGFEHAFLPRRTHSQHRLRRTIPRDLHDLPAHVAIITRPSSLAPSPSA